MRVLSTHPHSVLFSFYSILRYFTIWKKSHLTQLITMVYIILCAETHFSWFYCRWWSCFHFSTAIVNRWHIEILFNIFPISGYICCCCRMNTEWDKAKTEILSCTRHQNKHQNRNAIQRKIVHFGYCFTGEINSRTREWEWKRKWMEKY